MSPEVAKCPGRRQQKCPSFQNHQLKRVHVGKPCIMSRTNPNASCIQRLQGDAAWLKYGNNFILVAKQLYISLFLPCLWLLFFPQLFVKPLPLLFGRKGMTNLYSILKNKYITLPTKVCIVKAMVFPVGMYGCESWTIKKAGCRRIEAFRSWCWRRLLRVSWTAKRSNQSILKEVNPENSFEGLRLKLQYFGHLMQRADSQEKTVMLEKIERKCRRDSRG